jgi:hypothetical protein
MRLSEISKSSQGTLWLSGALLLAGLAAMLLLLQRVGVESALRSLDRVGPGVILVFLAPLVGMLLHTWAWFILLPRSLRPRPMMAFAAYVASQAGDELGAGVAGEPLKALVFPASTRGHTLVALALDNGTFITSTVLCLAGAALLPWDSTSLVSARTCTGLAVSSLAVVVIAVALILVGLPRRWGTSSGRLAQLVRLLDGARIALLSQPRLVLGSMLLHLVGKLWIVAEMALLLMLLGLPPALAPWLAAVSLVASALGAAIPAQMGVLEAGVFAACTAFGMDGATAMALVLLRRIRGGLWIALGLVLTKTVLAHGKARSADLAPRSARSTLRSRPILHTPTA